MKKKQLLNLLSGQTDHKEICDCYKKDIENKLEGVIGDNDEIDGIALLHKDEFQSKDLFTIFLKENDKVYVDQQLYALSCAITDFVIKHSQVKRYKTAYLAKRNSRWHIVSTIIVVVLIALVPVFTLLEERGVLQSGGLVATAIGAFDACFGMFSFLVERWSDDKKEQQFVENERQEKTRAEDLQEETDVSFNERMHNPSLVVNISKDDHSSNKREIHTEVYIEKYEQEDTENSEQLKNIGQELKRIQQEIQKLSHSDKADKYDVLKNDINGVIDQTKDNSKLLNDVLKQLLPPLSAFLESNKGNADVIAGIGSVADIINPAVQGNADADNNVELLKLKMQIYFDAMRNQYNDICLNLKLSFTDIKNYRENLSAYLTSLSIDTNKYKLSSLEKDVISALRPDIDENQRTANKMLDDLKKRYTVSDAEFNDALQNYINAIESEYNDICLNITTSFTRNVTECRNKLVRAAEAIKPDVDSNSLREWENRIMKVLRPDHEISQKNADSILDRYKQDVIKAIQSTNK